MTAFAAAIVTQDRLRAWQKRNAKEHICTPALLISVGHGADEGTVVLNTTEDLSTSQILVFLRHACQHLELQQAAYENSNPAHSGN